MRSLFYFAIQLLCITACACLIPLSGCAKPQALPKDWPIPQLTLPQGAKLVQVVALPGTERERVSVASYTAIFEDALPPEGVIADVEGKLKPLGYLRASSRVEPAPKARVYLNPDGQTQVLLDCQSGGPTGGRYSINITVVSPPMQELTRDATPL